MTRFIEIKRNTKEIKKWLLDMEMEVIDLANEAGASRQLASATIHGHRNNRKVLRTLRALGCPVEFLDLPDKLLKEAA